MEVHGNFVEVKFLFDKPIAEELQMMWNHLEAYGKLMNEYETNDDMQYPVMIFNIVPVNGEISELGYLTFTAPIFWFLQPRDLKRATELNEIRVLVSGDNFVINQ